MKISNYIMPKWFEESELKFLYNSTDRRNKQNLIDILQRKFSELHKHPYFYRDPNQFMYDYSLIEDYVNKSWNKRISTKGKIGLIVNDVLNVWRPEKVEKIS